MRIMFTFDQALDILTLEHPLIPKSVLESVLVTYTSSMSEPVRTHRAVAAFELNIVMRSIENELDRIARSLDIAVRAPIANYFARFSEDQ